MKVLSYGRQWIDEEDIAEVVKVLRGDWLTMGPTVEAFERALADYAGVRHAVAFSSGTAALHGAMAAADIGASRALTTALTFVATANAALYVGAEPVFGDIDPDTLCLDPGEAEARMKRGGIKAIVPVSFAGYPFEMAPFRTLADRYGAVLIEDASHSWGGEREGRKVGHDADMTTLSFHPVKHITTSEGGAVLTQSDEYARRLRLFRNHGVVRDAAGFQDPADGPWHSEMQSLGYNYRLPDMACALGLSQMRRLDSFVRRRRELAALYRQELQGIPDLILPPDSEGHAYHLFPIQVKDRAGLFSHLWGRGIHLQVHYRPVPLQPYYRARFGYAVGDFPEAERYYQRAISLPLFPLMEDGEVLRVCEAIREFMGTRQLPD